jgi:phage shock protein A
MRRVILLPVLAVMALVGCDDGERSADDVYGDDFRMESSTVDATIDSRMVDLEQRLSRLENNPGLDAEARDALNDVRQKYDELKAEMSLEMQDTEGTMDDLGDEIEKAYANLASEVERIENRLRS